MKTVKLIHPIDAGDKQVTEIVLRTPKFADVMALGEPTAYARSEGGLIYTAEKDGVIEAYIKRLMKEPANPDLLLQLSIEDALQLKEAVFDFFQDARKAISPNSSTG